MKPDLERVVGRPVSRETFDKLASYAELLKQESKRQNLISANSREHLWDRHILDAAQLYRFFPRQYASWVDVGSGAGLPGIVLACLSGVPGLLIEPRRLRAEFLRRLIEVLALDLSVVQRKVEQVSGRYDVITARAVASLPRLLGICSHLSTTNSTWILPKGRTAESELEEARRTWHGMFHVEQSATDADSRIIVSTGVRAKTR